MCRGVLTNKYYRNGVNDPKSPQKLSAESLAKVEDGPSSTEHYLQQEQNFERVSLGLDTSPSDMEATCRDWDLRWDGASTK
jgi:hypothetical protein